jgi:[pyruvate, water dikinase]-phosphate phosphotransferase / [pyruvate, water dikinase] kinase
MKKLSTISCAQEKKIIIHLLSDSSGQTVKYAAKSAITLFPEIEVKKYHWMMIRNKESLNEAMKKIKQKPGIILYTISDPELRSTLKQFCEKLKLPCISVVGKLVKEISSYLGIDVENVTLRANKFDESYFDKMDAIDYTIRHDDGQSLESLDEADIILIGPSRTSKTPTSVYLAYNGFKTANVPYVYNHNFPDSLDNVNNALIVGLIINPNRLVEIREARMNLLQMRALTDYTSVKIVQEECREVKKICVKKNWPIIDVSSRSIEETSAIIMKYYYEKKQS